MRLIYTSVFHFIRCNIMPENMFGIAVIPFKCLEYQFYLVIYEMSIR